jgi:hypothetical protein
MSKSQVRSAVRRKRAAVRKSRRGKPTRVRTYARNGVAPMTWLWLAGGTVLAAILVRKLVQEPIDRARGVASPGTGTP